MEKKKLVNIIKLLSIVIVLLVFFLTLVIVDKTNKKIVESNTKDVYAKVLESYDDFVYVKDINSSDKYTINTDNKYGVGDILYIEYLDDIENPTSIDLIISEDEEENEDIIEEEKITTEVVETTTSINKNVVKATNNTSVGTTKVVTTTSNENIDNNVINYAKTISNNIDTYVINDTNKEKAKECFVTIVDFIFYNGEINGYTFNELSNSAKAKVIYYALIIDSKIDNKWPSYKDTIKDKCTDIKAKLIAKYLDIASNVKENDPSLYENLKRDFSTLKYSLNLTWDVIKACFKYASSVTVSHLSSWYETFRG